MQKYIYIDNEIPKKAKRGGSKFGVSPQCSVDDQQKPLNIRRLINDRPYFCVIFRQNLPRIYQFIVAKFEQNLQTLAKKASTA